MEDLVKLIVTCKRQIAENIFNESHFHLQLDFEETDTQQGLKDMVEEVVEEKVSELMKENQE